MLKAPDLLIATPLIQEVDLLAAKVPGAKSWKMKRAPARFGTALGLAGVAAAGWYLAKRYMSPSTPYEALERTPVTAPL
jgi:hypothetical protein